MHVISANPYLAKKPSEKFCTFLRATDFQEFFAAQNGHDWSQNGPRSAMLSAHYVWAGKADRRPAPTIRTGMGNSGSDKPTRLLASQFASHTIRLIGHYVRLLDLSIEELVIIVLVYAESTRPIREDPYLAARFGYEVRSLPDEYRPPVSLKYIYNSLGLSRETARRRLEGLVARGFLAKTNGGYIFYQLQPGHELSRQYKIALTAFINDVAALINRT